MESDSCKNVITRPDVSLETSSIELWFRKVQLTILILLIPRIFSILPSLLAKFPSKKLSFNKKSYMLTADSAPPFNSALFFINLLSMHSTFEIAEKNKGEYPS